MWRDSFARYALAGWIRSPSAASTLVTGNRASQSISRSGCRVRSSRANATSRWAWPSPIGDEMYQGALAPGAPARPYAPLRAARGARRVRALGETAHQQVDLHRVARLGPVTGTLERDESSPDQLGEGRSRVVRTDGVGGPMRDQDRAADPGRALAYARRVREPRGELGRDERLGGGLQAPADRVLALLGRMRLAEHLGEEELEKVLVVLEPVVAVPLLPPLVGVVPALEHRLGIGARRGRGERKRRGDGHHSRHT